MIGDHGHDGNHVNGIIDLTENGIGVRQLFLQWALWARWIDYNVDEQKNLLFIHKIKTKNLHLCFYWYATLSNIFLTCPCIIGVCFSFAKPNWEGTDKLILRHFSKLDLTAASCGGRSIFILQSCRPYSYGPIAPV